MFTTIYSTCPCLCPSNQSYSREKKALRRKDNKIRELEEQLRNLMACLEAENTDEQQLKSDGFEDRGTLPMRVEPSSNSSTEAVSRTDALITG
ncbi:RING-type E3 ubiquitin transferase [Sarracenia purpurea var. burkii]